MPKGVSPFYPRLWFSLTSNLADMKMRVAVGESAYLDEQRAAWARLFEKIPLRFSPLSNLFWKVQDTRTKERLARLQLAMLSRSSVRESYVTSGPRFASANKEEMLFALADVWKRSSLQMHYVCQANGIEYYHFLQPNQYVPGSKALSGDELRIAYSAKSPYKIPVEGGYSYLVRAGSQLVKQGVHFYDLSMLFKDRIETLYIDDCCHVNKEGNILLGEAIAAAITQSGQ
jgi:hypothetical protein